MFNVCVCVSVCLFVVYRSSQTVELLGNSFQIIFVMYKRELRFQMVEKKREREKKREILDLIINTRISVNLRVVMCTVTHATVTRYVAV